jgi:hypothetical protein
MVLRCKSWVLIRLCRSSVIESLESSSSQNDAVAYIYFEQDLVDLASAPANLLSAILKQLVSRQPCISANMRKFYMSIKEQGNIGRSDWKDSLKDECSEFRRVFIILDALDRGDENVVNMLFRDLKALSADTGNIKILASSLNMPNFGIILGDPKRVDFVPDPDEVKSYLEKRIEDSARIGRFVRRLPSLRQEIIDVVSKKTQGL